MFLIVGFVVTMVLIGLIFWTSARSSERQLREHDAKVREMYREHNEKIAEMYSSAAARPFRPAPKKGER